MTTKGITVVTPTLPSRRELLLEAMESVEDQIHSPVAHLIGVDVKGGNTGQIRSALTEAARTEWVAYLDDDDVLEPKHLDTLLWAARHWDADLVYPWCQFNGPPLPRQYYNQHYDRGALRERGIFPITVLVKREAVLRYEAFRDEDTYEDWALWNRMADGGCRIVGIPEITWTYRTGHKSRTTEAMEGRR